MKSKKIFSIEEISKKLNITNPFLMIDEVIELTPGNSITACKYLTEDDWYFKCHLPGLNAMPATMLTEAMLQTLVFAIYSIDGINVFPSLITNVKVKIISNVKPPEKIFIKAKIKSFKRGVAIGEATIHSEQENKVICSGEFSYVSSKMLPKIKSS